MLVSNYLFSYHTNIQYVPVCVTGDRSGHDSSEIKNPVKGLWSQVNLIQKHPILTKLEVHGGRVKPQEIEIIHKWV